jgi:glycerol-3-phosphate dehydrogenase
VRVEAEDVAYLLEAANYYLPGASLSETSVLHSFAGLRPLVATGDDHGREGDISRRHLVLREPAGVVTLLGGKFTTFRRMAQDAVDALLDTLATPRRACVTASKPYFETSHPSHATTADPDLWSDLSTRYGPRAGQVYDVCLSQPGLSDPAVEGYSLRLGELVFALQQEKALYSEDLLERRTRLNWYPELADALKPHVEELTRYRLKADS